MKQKLTRRVIILAALSLAVLVINAVLAMQYFATHARESHLQQQVLQTRLQLEELHQSLIDAETAQRGFMLTGDERLLEPFQRAEPQFRPLLEKLKSSVLPDRRFAQLWDTLAVRVIESQAVFIKGIEARRREASAEDLATLTTETKQTVDAARESLSASRSTIENVRSDLEAESDRVTTFGWYGILGTMVLAIGLFLALVSLARKDLNQWNRIHSQIFLEHERLQVTLSGIGDGVMATDTQGRVTLVNPVAEQLTGWIEGEALGKPLTDVFPIINQTTRQIVENPVERVLKEGRIVGLANHTVLVSRSGKETSIADSAAPIRNQRGEIVGTVLVFRDATVESERERLLEERARLGGLRMEVSTALTRYDDLPTMLQACTDALGHAYAQAQVGIWLRTGDPGQLLRTANTGVQCLRESAVGLLDINSPTFEYLLAGPRLSNDINAFEAVLDRTAVENAGVSSLVSFPLKVGEKRKGLLVMLAARRQPETMLADLETLAAAIALGIDRRKLEATQREAEQKFEVIINSTDQFAWLADSEGYLYWYNDRWYEYTGTTFEDMRGEGWKKVHDPAELPRIVARWQEHITSGEPWEDTFPLRGKDGQFRWYLSRAMPLRDDAGHIKLWVGTNTDITRQRETLAAHARSEQAFRELANSMPQMVWVARPNGAFEYFNNRWYEYVGGTEADWIDRSWQEAFPVHPDDAQEAWNRWADSLQSGDPCDLECRIRGSDGRYRWFLVRALAVRDEPGTITRWYGTSTDIDDRRHLDEELRRSEAFVRNVLESSPDCVKIVNTDGIIEWINQRGCALLEIAEASQVIGQAWTGRWGDKNALAEQALVLARSGREFRFRGESPTATGEMRSWDIATSPIFGSGASPERTLVVSRDVTEQKIYEERLAASQQFLKSSVDAIPSHVVVLDGSGTILRCNRSWTEFAQSSPALKSASSEGNSLLDAMRSAATTDEEYARLIPPIESVMTGKTPMSVQTFSSATPEGIRWFQRRIVHFLDSGSTCVAISDEDVTERILSEEATRRRSEQVRHLAGIASDLNVASTPEQILHVVTRGARQIIGANEAQCEWKTGDHKLSTISKITEDTQAVSAPGEHDQRGTNQRYQTDAIPDPDRWHQGEELQAATTLLNGRLAARLTGHDGKGLGLIQVGNKSSGSFTQDDSAILVQLAQMGSVAVENARLYHDLREADTRKDHFLATLGHELRNPLSPLFAASQLISMAPGDTNLVREYSGVITRQCEHLKRLIDDLLDISRISSGKLTLRTELMPLSESIHAATDVSKELITLAGHTLTVEESPTPLYLEGDRVRVSQIVGNLLVNAAKYTPQNGRIRLRTFAEQGYAVIEVSDNGVGIPPQMLSSIFGLFTQVDSSRTRSHGGLGIGLTLVKTLTELHGGTIVADSDGDGHGSTFTVRLPLARSELKAAREPTPDPESEGLPQYRILVVDDNRSASFLLRRLLEKLGQEVLVADSAQKALEVVGDYAPDIMISDIGMPGMSGYELARHIRERSDLRQLVLIALTGYGQDSDREEALAAGFNDHLTKPAGLESLTHMLRTIPSP